MYAIVKSGGRQHKVSVGDVVEVDRIVGKPGSPVEFKTLLVVDGEQVTVLELRVHPEDLGKVIGRQGRTAKSMRTILGAAGMKLRKRLTLEILE